MSVTAYIALGSNLGDRKANLDGAIQALRETPGITVGAVSTYYETEPVGWARGHNFFNAAAELQTTLSPEDLLKALLQIEQRFFRVRNWPNAPRTLDLDLLLYGDLIRSDADPIIPHPRMLQRAFVLLPLMEIAPNAWHPVLGQTIAEILNPPIQEGERHAEYEPRPLQGPRALVTGSTSGIGLAIAEAFVSDGTMVIVHGRNAEGARKVARTFQAKGVPSRDIVADLREPSAVERLAHVAWNLWQGLDIVVLNAGADTLTGEAAKWPFERKFAELWAVDVQSTIRLARQLGAAMKKQGHGVILTMGWDQAETGMEGDSGQLFAATKGAVMAFTKSLALSLAPEVRVNCLDPGWIKTAWAEKASEAWQKRAVAETPMHRWGTPEDVANVARWLVSPAAQFITGQIIRINGGAVR